MSQQTAQTTQDQIRAARRDGFKTAIGHMPTDRQKKFVDSHTRQDDRREKNVSGFYKTVLGDRK
jgi:hypothetical protein